MKKSAVLSVVVSACAAVALFAFPTGAFAQPHATKVAEDTYSVLKIGDEYKVVSTKSIPDEKKHALDDYQTKYKEWQDLKKSDPTAKRPIKPLVKPVGGKFNTQEGAQKFADKMLEDDEKGKKK